MAQDQRSPRFKGPRTAVMFRMPETLHRCVRQHAADHANNVRDYLAALVVDDLEQPRALIGPTPTPATRTGRVGRPSKGSRHAIILKLPDPIARQLQDRAGLLGMTITDYLNALVSHDIGETTDPEDRNLERSA